MIIGIGSDLVEHNLTTILSWESNDKLLKRFLSLKELELYENQKNRKFLSGRFAAKEAVLKCLGTGMQDGISLTDIQILRLESDKPIIEILGEVKNISDQMGIKSWHLSITHSTNYSLALVIAES